MFLLKANIIVYKSDIVVFSKRTSSTRHDNDNLEIAGYDIARADHPNTKRGRVFVSYKNFLPLRVLNIVFLNECIKFEFRIWDKSCNFAVLYRLPSQSQDFVLHLIKGFRNDPH